MIEKWLLPTCYLPPIAGRESARSLVGLSLDGASAAKAQPTRDRVPSWDWLKSPQGTARYLEPAFGRLPGKEP